MKINSILNKKIPLWVIGIILLVVAFLAIVGFRITYAPELENSWGAISAVASWAGVATTIAAIIVAIQIPQKIADNQNKIALFDKRYEVYDTITHCVAFSKIIDSMSREKLTAEDIQILFVACFSASPKISSMDEIIKYEKNSLVVNVVTAIEKGELLFNINIKNELSALKKPLMDVLLIPNDQTFVEDVSRYIEIANQIDNNTLPKIEKTLYLGN